MADLVGIYLVMSRVSGKGSVKVLIAGLGWAFAELVLTRLVTLKVQERLFEFPGWSSFGLERVVSSSTGGAKPNLYSNLQLQCVIYVNNQWVCRFKVHSEELWGQHLPPTLHHCRNSGLCFPKHFNFSIWLFFKVWMWTKRNSTHSGGVTGVLSLVLAIACYKVYSQ